MPEPAPITLALPSVRLAALDYGEPAPGAPTMVLLHGQADLAWSMDPVARHFADRFRVVSVDQRGHGDSEHPGSYGLLHLVGDVRGVVDQLGWNRTVVVGHSLGGQVASQFAGLFPERVQALVVAEGIGPPVRIPDDSTAARLAAARGRVELVAAPARLRPMASVAEAAARLVAVHPGLDTERARLLAERGTRPGPDGGVVWKFDPRTRHWVATFDRSLVEERWAAVRCPVLVVTGALAWERWWKDQIFAAQAEDWSGRDPAEITRRVALFADAEHVELADAGHMLPFDDPDGLNAAIADFLARRLGA